MGDFQVKKQTKKYDVIIVGSGAGGGMAAYTLAKAGLKVCLLEAGYMYDPQKNVTQLKNPWESPRRGASTKVRPFGDFDACYGGWSLEGEPYTKENGTEWAWWRARMLGGRTNHWGRISGRLAAVAKVSGQGCTNVYHTPYLGGTPAADQGALAFSPLV